MIEQAARKAGNAFIWKIIQLGTSQAVNLVRMLILASLLVPEDFGLMSIGLATLNTILAITDVGMLPALIQQIEIEEDHYHAAWTAGFLRAAVISATFLFGASLIAELFSEPQAVPIIRVLAIRPLLDALSSIKIAKLYRELNFRSLAFIQISSVLIETVVSILLARTLGVWALVAGMMAGALAMLVLSYLFAPYKPCFMLNLQVARPLIRYGRWIFLSNVAAVSGSLILQVVISRQLGAISLGLYYLALRLAFLPNEVSAKVVGEVAFPLYARLKSDPQKIVKAFQTIYTGLAAMLFPVYGLLIAFAPALTEDILGERWVGSAPIIRILALAGMIGLLGDAAIPLFKGLGYPNKVVLLEFAQSVLMIAGVWWLTDRFDLIGTAFAWLPATLASQILAILFLTRQIRHPFTGLGKTVLSIIIASGVGAFVGLSLENKMAGLTGFFIAMCLGALAIGVLLLILNRILNLGLITAFREAFPQLYPLIEWMRTRLKKDKIGV